MAGTALSIKLRCASWQQLATIYRRDLTRGSMFLKASSQPPLGTVVRIDLELPSSTVIELSGVIVNHVVDPQRGTGVDLKLEPLPTKSVWMIESALAAEASVHTSSESVAGIAPTSSLTEGEDVAAAEQELIAALEAEAESLRKLNPFLVLGVGYEASDGDVRAAFGELTKRYHPDRYTRYQSERLRQLSAEIFILIRDAYRKLADQPSRHQVIATLEHKAPTRAPSHPRVAPAAAVRTSTSVARVPPRAPTPPPVPNEHDLPTRQKAVHDVPTRPGPHEAPTNQSAKSAQLAHTELARADQLAIPAVPAEPPVRPTPEPKSEPIRTGAAVESGDSSEIEAMLDGGKLDQALAAYRVLAKKHPHDKVSRAGIELCEGLRALAERDRLEAAQRFEAALELDPSSERAARELAEMRRQATNERKGLLSRLMGKKEPSP